MSPLAIVGIILGYFILLVAISYFTSKGADNESFFTGNKNSKWYLVAFGMVGASLSGVTFVSVPGWVQNSQFSYMQMVFGYLVGYFIVANVLMPLYYRLNLTSIYTYLEQRFGFWSYKTGAFYFLLSRIIGASFRLFLVASVFQIAVFDSWGVPFWVTVAITILLIWIYTFKGGIKTIVWTDTLQTFFMLSAVGITIVVIGLQLDWSFVDMISQVNHSEYSKLFFFENWNDKQYFFKSFLSGVFITIVMTGLDQDMMQKNLSCKNIKEAKWNMYAMSVVLVVVTFVFLFLGALLFLYANQKGIEIPSRTDELFPMLATGGYLGYTVAVCFILGLIAAAYSSADSALTALTTSFCVDILEVKKKALNQQTQLRQRTHIGMSVVLFLVILLFELINDDSVVDALFKAASYTYGPLLGLYAFGLFTKYNVVDRFVPLICLLSPIFCYILNLNSEAWLGGYQFGYDLLIVNGGLTFLGLFLIRKRRF
jgi:solute:Na+ symporter, SSS family